MTMKLTRQKDSLAPNGKRSFMKKMFNLIFALWHVLIIVWQFLFLITSDNIRWSEKIICPLIVFLFLFLFFLESRKNIKKQNVIIIEILFLFALILFDFVATFKGLSIGG